MAWITILYGMDLLDDHLSLATSYLSVVITRSACFGALHASTSSHDVMSVHNDVNIWLWLATFRTLCIVSNRGHPRVSSFSVASFLALRSHLDTLRSHLDTSFRYSFRYSLYTIS